MLRSSRSPSQSTWGCERPAVRRKVLRDANVPQSVAKFVTTYSCVADFGRCHVQSRDDLLLLSRLRSVSRTRDLTMLSQQHGPTNVPQSVRDGGVDLLLRSRLRPDVTTTIFDDAIATALVYRRRLAIRRGLVTTYSCVADFGRCHGLSHREATSAARGNR